MIPTRTLSKDDIVYFVHVPKTAGTSFISVLAGYFSKREFFPFGLPDYLKRYKKAELEAYRCFHGHFLDLPLEEYLPNPPTCRVTILRDPLRRAASYYRHMQSEKPPPHFYKANSLDLGSFLKDADVRTVTKDLQTRYLVWESLGRTSGLTDEQLLETAKKELTSFDFFGITERFEESLLLMAFVLGLEPPAAVPRCNRSDAMANSCTLSTGRLVERFSEQLQQANRGDLGLYAYATDVFQQRYRQMLDVLSEGQPHRLAGDPQATRRALGRWLKGLKRTKECRYRIIRRTANPGDRGRPKQDADDPPRGLKVLASGKEQRTRRPERLKIEIDTLVEQPAGRCGCFDEMTLSDDGVTVHVRGWAYDPTELRPAEEVLVVTGSSRIRSTLEKSGDGVCLHARSLESPAHRIIAHGKVNQPREDVAAHLRARQVPLASASEIKYGWEARFHVRLLQKGDTSVRVYAYFPKKRMLLRIGSELEIPPSWLKKPTPKTSPQAA